MAFSSTITSRENLGSNNMLYGTYTNGTADTGGTITTGFGVITMFGVVPTGNVEETMPKYAVSSGVVTLITNQGSSGNWFAVGK